MAKRKNYDRLPPVQRGPEYFLDALLGLGVDFWIDGDRLVALGPGVSPLLQREVDRRAPELIRILLDAGLACGVMSRSAQQAKAGKVRIEKEPDRMDLIRTGIEGAKKQAAKKRAIVKAKIRVRRLVSDLQ